MRAMTKQLSSRGGNLRKGAVTKVLTMAMAAAALLLVGCTEGSRDTASPSLLPPLPSLSPTASSSPVIVEMPDVIGLPSEAARSTLYALGLIDFRVTLRSQETTDVAPGRVLRQEPAAGEGIEDGSVTYLTIAKAPVDLTAEAEAQLCDPLPQVSRVFDGFTRYGSNPTGANGGRLVGHLTGVIPDLREAAASFTDVGEDKVAKRVRAFATGFDQIRVLVLGVMAGQSPSGEVPNTTELLSNAYVGVDC